MAGRLEISSRTRSPLGWQDSESAVKEVHHCCIILAKAVMHLSLVPEDSITLPGHAGYSQCSCELFELETFVQGWLLSANKN